MRTRWSLRVGALALTLCAISTVNALEAMSSDNVAAIRLLPPAPQPTLATAFSTFRPDVNGALRIIRERHPEVLDTPSRTGRYAVAILFKPDGSVETSEARAVEDLDRDPLSLTRDMTQGISRTTTMMLQKGMPLPDGTRLGSDLVLQMGTLSQPLESSQLVNRVQKVVRERHADLLMPASGEVLNRLTVFLTEGGQIERESVEQIRFDSLRRAPLEDEKFAERMAERLALMLTMDVAKIGAVGFTYVEDGSFGGAAADRRTLLVQYAWPRKPGDPGPSMPMANQAQQQPRIFDNAAALALAEHYFKEAFNNRESAAGTPTILLNTAGEVIRTGMVQYGSGEIHENSLRKQLMPDITLANLITPTLKNSTGASAVVTFAWVSNAAPASLR